MKTHVHLVFAAALSVVFASVARAQDGQTGEPTAMDLVVKAIEAMGGMEALEEKQSISHRTKMTFPAAMGGQSFEATVQLFFPLHMRADVKVPDLGEAIICSNGEHIWTQDPGMDDYQVDEPDAAGLSIVLTPYVQFGVTMMNHADLLTYVGMTEFGDARCQKVDVAQGKGAHVKELFFNAKTGLPAGLLFEGPDGEDTQLFFAKWEDVDGIKMVTEASFPLMDNSVSLTFDDFTWNKVTEDVFAMPDAVKKTIADRAASKDGGEESTAGADDGGK